MNTIGRKAVDILAKYGKENGYAAILDGSSQQTPVVYAAAANDITQDIIRIYDQTYPVKAGKAASAPKSSGTEARYACETHAVKNSPRVSEFFDCRLPPAGLGGPSLFGGEDSPNSAAELLAEDMEQEFGGRPAALRFGRVTKL